MKLNIQIIGPDYGMYTVKIGNQWVTNKLGLCYNFKSKSTALSAAFVWLSGNEFGLHKMLKILQNEIK